MSEHLSTPTRWQQFNVWTAHHLPWFWGRYWGSRLMATTYYSQQLSEERPEIRGWMNTKRHALGLALFLLPVPLPVRPQFHSQPDNLLP